MVYHTLNDMREVLAFTILPKIGFALLILLFVIPLKRVILRTIGLQFYNFLTENRAVQNVWRLQNGAHISFYSQFRTPCFPRFLGSSTFSCGLRTFGSSTRRPTGSPVGPRLSR